MDDRRSVREEKARLRARFAAWRRALGDADYAARSALIRDRLAALPAVQSAATVHLYWPLVDKREPDLRPLADALLARGTRVVLPVVEDGPQPRLRHALFEGADRLRPGRWNLLESSGPEVDVVDLDLVIVPAFGAGRNGHRIGHGAGYYDAFLSGVQIATVCPVYDACLVAHVPAEPHDRPVDLIVTETETVRV